MFIPFTTLIIKPFQLAVGSLLHGTLSANAHTAFAARWQSMKAKWVVGRGF
jgi:hypothetical protein